MATRKKSLDGIDAEQLREIGRAIRETRRGRLSLEALAERADISAGQLSQIENGRSNPTIETLIRLGTALDVDVVDFIERRPPMRTYVVRAADRRQYQAINNTEEVTLLTPDIRHEYSVNRGHLEPGESITADQHHGDLVFYVLRGELTVRTATSTHVATEGDALSCRTPTSLTNAGPRAVDYLGVFRPEDDD